jgi:Phage integrase, N-terminal SAM-like domain/Arm DNA-binding domain
MDDKAASRRRGNSRPNVRRRGATYTYYLYVTGPDGRRRQHSKGGFRTQREAEEARIAAAHALATGSYVKAERISFVRFLADEWIPSRRPPVLEESTWHSYDRYLRLHVIPYIGGVPLQQLTPVDLNELYRLLLESGRRQPRGPAGRPSAVRERAATLRAAGLSHEQVAEALRAEFPDEAAITKSAVAALLRRAAEPRMDGSSAGLAPRTVRYIHTIIHAALRDALRWNRVVRNVADAATPPPAGAARSHRPKAWTAEQLRAFLDYAAQSPTCRRGSSSPRAAAGGASASVFAGATSTSTRRRQSSPAK